MQKKKKIIIATISLIIAILLLLGISSATILAENGIYKGVTIAKATYYNRSQEEVINLCSEVITNYEGGALSYTINDKELSIPLIDVEYDCDVNKTVDGAFTYGRRGFITNRIAKVITARKKGVDFPYEASINTDVLKEKLESFAAQSGILTKDYTYTISGPSLIVSPAVGKERFNLDHALAATMEKISVCDVSPIVLETSTIENAKIDAKTLHDQIACSATDAALVSENGHTVLKPQKNGLDFSVEEATKILSEDKEEYIIPITILYPKITTDSLIGGSFKDTLGTYASNYDGSNVPRTQNLKIAARKINETILMPGDVFSFNGIVGERTVSAGYKDATIFVGNKMTPGLAGGICQISSTLYNAVLLADLEIVERKNHSFYVSYVPKGLDATVSYGSIDFKFKNNTENPIKILASVNGGVATMKVLGTQTVQGKTVSLSSSILSKRDFAVVEEKDPSRPLGEIKTIQEGMPGYTVSATRTVSVNGQVVRTDRLSNSVYIPLNKTVSVGTGGASSQPSDANVAPQPTPTPAPSDIPSVVIPKEPTPQETPLPPVGGEPADKKDPALGGPTAEPAVTQNPSEV